MTVINVKQADGNDDTRIFITIVGQSYGLRRQGYRLTLIVQIMCKFEKSLKLKFEKLKVEV